MCRGCGSVRLRGESPERIKQISDSEAKNIINQNTELKNLLKQLAVHLSGSKKQITANDFDDPNRSNEDDPKIVEWINKIKTIRDSSLNKIQLASQKSWNQMLTEVCNDKQKKIHQKSTGGNHQWQYVHIGPDQSIEYGVLSGTETDGKYIGHRKNGKKNGQGIMRYANGEYQDGEWRDNRFTGEGKNVLPNGLEFSGRWNDGKMIGPIRVSKNGKQRFELQYDNDGRFLKVTKSYYIDSGKPEDIPNAELRLFFAANTSSEELEAQFFGGTDRMGISFFASVQAAVAELGTSSPLVSGVLNKVGESLQTSVYDKVGISDETKTQIINESKEQSILVSAKIRGHAIWCLIRDKHIFVCNKGEGAQGLDKDYQTCDSIVRYDAKDDNELSQMIDIISRSYKTADDFYKEFEAQNFEQQKEKIRQKTQNAGNCSYMSLKTAIYAEIIEEVRRIVNAIVKTSGKEREQKMTEICQQCKLSKQDYDLKDEVSKNKLIDDAAKYIYKTFISSRATIEGITKSKLYQDNQHKVAQQIREAVAAKQKRWAENDSTRMARQQQQAAEAVSLQPSPYLEPADATIDVGFAKNELIF